MAARPEKVAVVDEVKASLDGAVATILTDYRGLSVGELAQLRIELRKANASYKVAKNTLMRRAADEAQVAITDLLVGPTALVFCEEDPVGPAKALKAFAKDHPELVVKGSWLDGELLDAEQTIKLADLESREELLAKLAGLMYGALANTARLLNAAPTKLAQLMAALEAEGGVEAKGFSPTGPEPAPADAPTDEAPADEVPTDEAPTDEAPTDEPEAADTTDDAPEASAEPSDGGIAAAAASAVAGVAETVTDAATDVVETAAAVTAGAAETVADAAESAAEAVAPDEPEADDEPEAATDDEPEATTDDEPEATTDDAADDEPEASDEPEAADADAEPAADDETDQA